MLVKAGSKDKMNSHWRSMNNLAMIVIIKKRRIARCWRFYGRFAWSGRAHRRFAAHFATASSQTSSNPSTSFERQAQQTAASMVGTKSVSRISQYSPFFRDSLSQMSDSRAAADVARKYGRRG